MTLTEIIRTEIKYEAMKLRKQHQTTDLAILETAITTGATLMLIQLSGRVHETREDLEKQRNNSNQQQ